MLASKEFAPTAVFAAPVVFSPSASNPIAVLLLAVVLASKALPPTAVLLAPVEFTFNEL